MDIQLKNGLVGHWPFRGDGAGSPGQDHKLTFGLRGPNSEPASAASFNGVDSRIEVADQPGLRFGTGDFSIAVWIHTEARTADVVGDIVSKFDPDARRGFNLGVVTGAGQTTSAQSNYRNVHFGIDNAQLDPAWTDCGRPGRAVNIYSLGVWNNRLYAGTIELEADERGHLWRYDGGQQWIDCGGTPDGSSAVPSVAEFDGNLFCCTGRYNTVGSRLGPAKNTRPGGSVYRIEADGRWVDCGRPGGEDATPEERVVPGYETGKADEATSLTVYHGQLYVTSHHRRGAFVYEGGKKWKYIGPNLRVYSIAIHHDRLYALINGGPIYRYEGGSDWTDCGTPAGATQIYSAVTYGGEFYVGTWPNGALFRYEGGQSWKLVAPISYEKEIMGMALYNGKVYCGSLPMANSWRLDREGWTFVGNVDNTPTAYLRRLWSMAVYRGKLFGGTLPSGHVWSLEAGRMATSDEALASGWRHIAAMREGGRLRLWIDGQPAAESSPFHTSDYDLGNDQPLRIGFGVGHPFRGAMSDLRLYNRALTPREIDRLASEGSNR